MIQLSIQPGAETAKAPQTAAFSAAPEGLFAAMLEGQMPPEDGKTGKALPEGGKKLPVDPAIAEKTTISAKEAGLNALAALTGKSANPEDEDGENAGQAQDQADDIAIPVIVAIVPQTIKTVSTDAAGTGALLGRDGTPVPLPATPLPISLPESEKGEQSGPANAPLPKLAPAASSDPARMQAVTAEALSAAADAAAKADDAAAPAKDQAAARLPVSRQIRIELGQEAKGDATSFKAIGDPRSSDRALQAPIMAQAGSMAMGDGASAQSAQNAPRVSFQTPAGIQPHDFGALVDRLVEAREAARPHSVDLAVMNSDFGEVSLRFSHDDKGLTVSMASNDPEFTRAVGNALPADRAGTGEGTMQNSRRDDGAQQFSQGAGDSAAAGNNGGEGRAPRDTRNEPAASSENPSQRTASGSARNGIFA
jgi:hypothetical protein